MKKYRNFLLLAPLEVPNSDVNLLSRLRKELLSRVRLLTGLAVSCLLLAVFLFGCMDYQTSPIIPEGAKKITIATFTNKTVQYGLEDILVHALNEEFLRDGRLTLTKKSEADLFLTGVIAEYKLEPIAYDPNNIVEQYRLWIRLNVSLTNAQGKLLWEERQLDESTTYFITPRAGEVVETEIDAQKRVVEDLARLVVARVVGKW